MLMEVSGAGVDPQLILEKWTHPVQNWNLTLSQLSIHFPARLNKHLDL
ncbi:hypothetical protein [Vibrio aerogenes]|nr:hypothetical protein [Vibrio aerogenes]